ARCRRLRAHPSRLEWALCGAGAASDRRHRIMCGIAGILRFDGRPVDPAVIQSMLDAIAHRGPDGEGKHIEGSAGLGHRRLAIIDLGGGAQPMSVLEGRVWITFNGEIYNFKELR